MSTPVTVHQREEALRRRQAREQQLRETLNQNPGGHYHQPNQRIQQNNRWQYRQPQNFSQDSFEDSAAYKRFDWDDWRMQQPSSTVSSPNNSPMPECIEFWGSSRIQELSFHLDADRVVMFNNAESPFSTFYKVNIRISGVHYPSVENYYQACKIYSLIGNYAVWNFKNLKDGFSAKKNAKSVIKKEGISPKVVESWKNEGGVQAVFYATYYKFKQNPRLRKRLFQTGDNLIVHDYKNDKIYSSGCDKETLLNWLADHDGKLLHVVFDARNFNNNSFPLIAEGHNVVGYVTMMVREKLKEEYPQEFEIAQTSVEDQSQNNSEDIDKVVRGVGNI